MSGSWLRAKLLSLLIDGQVLVRSGNGFAGAEISTLTPAGNWLPGTTASYDLGVTATRWRDLFLSRNATVGGALVMAPSAGASGVRSALSLTGAADTALTAATEQTDVDLHLGRTVTWASGAGPLASQRAIRVRAPTYAGNVAAALTITHASTLEIDNAPQAGANITLSNAWALRVVAGGVYLGGATTLGSTLAVTGATTLSAAAGVVIDDATVNAVTRGLTLSHTTTGTATDGVGAGMLFRAESGAGTLRSAGAVDAIHTDVTDGAEESALVLSVGRAGALLEAARFVAEVSAVNGLLVVGSATGQPVILHARGADTDVTVGLRAKGAGGALLVAGGGTVGVRVSDAGTALEGSAGFFGATPATQPTAVGDAAGGATVDAEARSALNALLARMRTLGLIAT